MTLTEQEQARNEQPRVTEQPAEARGFRVQSGLRAGDVYLQYPRGSNNRP